MRQQPPRPRQITVIAATAAVEAAVAIRIPARTHHPALKRIYATVQRVAVVAVVPARAVRVRVVHAARLHRHRRHN